MLYLQLRKADIKYVTIHKTNKKTKQDIICNAESNVIEEEINKLIYYIKTALPTIHDQVTYLDKKSLLSFILST